MCDIALQLMFLAARSAAVVVPASVSEPARVLVLGPVLPAAWEPIQDLYLLVPFVYLFSGKTIEIHLSHNPVDYAVEKTQVILCAFRFHQFDSIA